MSNSLFWSIRSLRSAPCFNFSAWPTAKTLRSISSGETVPSNSGMYRSKWPMAIVNFTFVICVLFCAFLWFLFEFILMLTGAKLACQATVSVKILNSLINLPVRSEKAS